MQLIFHFQTFNIFLLKKYTLVGNTANEGYYAKRLHGKQFVNGPKWFAFEDAFALGLLSNQSPSRFMSARN